MNGLIKKMGMNILPYCKHLFVTPLFSAMLYPITDLKPGTLYQIEVTPLVDGIPSDSVTVQARTSKDFFKHFLQNIMYIIF